jgi:hypothetical protein
MKIFNCRTHLPDTTIWLALTLIGLMVLTMPTHAQVEQYKGDPLHRYEGIHSGNKIQTIYYNYGLIGNAGEISGEWPAGTGNQYVGDVTMMVGIEFVHPSNRVIQSVITCRATPRRFNGDYDQFGVHWGFEPLPGFGAPPLQETEEAGKVAMSHLPETWPPFWPDKMYTDERDIAWEVDNNDAGWRGQWNGYFGKDVTNADQESYWQMDDHMDREFRTLTLIDPETGEKILDNEGNDIPVTFYPTAQDTSRGGLGIRVGARGFQWSHFLAEDAIVWQYEITNISDHNYDKVTFGELVGTLAGGRGDTDDDLAFFDPENDITYSYDENNGPSRTQGWVPVSNDHEVGWIGYAFLESPGNEFDGIDNDLDASPNSPRLTTAQLTEWTIDGIHHEPETRLVLIDYDTYERTVVTMPASGELIYDFRGTPQILSSDSLLIEDGYNGFDDNFNGLIDERYVQPGEDIDARLDHVDYAYKDYLGNRGLDDPMIDEARDDGIDNDGDWDSDVDDVGFDGQAGTGDLGEGDGEPTLGEPNFDKTDINESDQIGLTSFDYFNIRLQEIQLRDDNDLWTRLRPGYIDVVPNTPMDGDFVYGSGYFPLPSGNTQRFSTALFFGEDSVDVFLNKKTVQQIYDSNYNFARPPDTPTVTVVAGDGFVTLYWDDIAEFSYDTSQPTGDELDFEGYKIYRATDPGFLENFIITDGLGRKVFHKPIVQFDLDDDKKGFFPGGDIGVSFYLGNDSGLEHVWTDSTVENGQQYFYAISAYDFGNDSTGVFPAETSKYVFVDQSGIITTDKNTVVVTPSPNAAGYRAPFEGAANHFTGSGDIYGFVEVVNPTVVPDDVIYHINYTDPNELNEAERYGIFEISGDDSVVVLSSRPANDFRDLSRIYDLYDSMFDTLYGSGTGEFDPKSFFVIQETQVFDGMRAFILQPRNPSRVILPQTGWDLFNAVHPDSMISFRINPVNYPFDGFIGDEVAGDYLVEFTDEVIDTSMFFNAGILTTFYETPMRFRVTNLSRNYQPPLLFKDNEEIEGEGEDPDGYIESGSEIVVMEVFDQDGDGVQDTVATWSFTFKESVDSGKLLTPRPGDKYNVSMYETATPRDAFEFTSSSAFIDQNAVNLDRIKVYPNPYLAQNKQEPENPYSTGRGERRVTFNHLPNHCTIRIYTVRGELVDTIDHDEVIFDGSANWDLRNSDGLDVAYGVYVFHVDSEWGTKIGKFALIK